MARLEKLTEYLFTHPGTSMCLDSDGPGYYLEPNGTKTAIFKQPLLSAQILLLFSEVVPRDRSQEFLAGSPIHFIFDTVRGALDVHMEMNGKVLQVGVRVAAVNDRTQPYGGRREPAVAAVPSPSAAVVETPTPKLILSVIERLVEKHASHLHLTPGQHAFSRVHGRLVCLEELGVLNDAQIRDVAIALAPQSLREGLFSKSSFEFSHMTKDALFHLRGQVDRKGLGVVVHAVPRQVPAPVSLDLPDDFASMLQGSGLWVIAGGAGQGTSTTVASLLQEALSSRAMSVCTLESPAGYVLEARKGLVQQLEIGVHVPSYAAALNDAACRDVEVVVVGQLEDADTLAAALALADRGRLVVGVVHSRSAVAAVRKLVELSPRGSSLANSLRGVFGQTLVPGALGGRRLCWELLPATDAVRACLLDGALGQLPSLLVHTIDHSLMELVACGDVDPEVALAHAQDRNWLHEQLSRLGSPSRAA